MVDTDAVSPKSDKKAPGFWFFTADYEKDMQILSLAAQGLWSRMLCWMSDNEDHRGFCELPTGEPMGPVDVARRVGKPVAEIKKVLAEMSRVGVFSVDERGCFYSRRMARDTHISEVRREAARMRHDIENRAATGKFCKDFAGAKSGFANGFAGAKVPAKRMQKPTVTVPDSDSVPDSVKPTPAAATKLEDSPPPRTAELKSKLHQFASGNPQPDSARAVAEEAIRKHEWMREVLTEYPGSQGLPGKPDDGIIKACLLAADQNLDAIRNALKEMYIAHKKPSTSWAWFPAVIEVYTKGHRS